MNEVIRKDGEVDGAKDKICAERLQGGSFKQSTEKVIREEKIESVKGSREKDKDLKNIISGFIYTVAGACPGTRGMKQVLPT